MPCCSQAAWYAGESNTSPVATPRAYSAHRKPSTTARLPGSLQGRLSAECQDGGPGQLQSLVRRGCSLTTHPREQSVGQVSR